MVSIHSILCFVISVKLACEFSLFVAERDFLWSPIVELVPSASVSPIVTQLACENLLVVVI